MSQTVTRPETIPDPETIRENNDAIDRLVDGFESRVDRFLRRHRGKLHLLAFVLAVAWATPSFVPILLGLPLVVVGLGLLCTDPAGTASGGCGFGAPDVGRRPSGKEYQAVHSGPLRVMPPSYVSGKSHNPGGNPGGGE